MQYITFVNNTPFPVMVETWKSNGIYGLSELSGVIVNEYHEIKCIYLPDPCLYSINSPTTTAVNPKELTLYSITGEWYINSLFTDPDISARWKTHKLPQTEIAKFRTSPCASGDYFWMNIENHFNMYYNKMEKKLYFFHVPKVMKEQESHTP